MTSLSVLRRRVALRSVALLACLLLGQPMAQAKKPVTPDVVKQFVLARGIGRSIKVTRTDGVIVVGVITAIRDDTFDVTPKKVLQATSIPYTQVTRAKSDGMSVAGKIGTGVLIGVVAFSTIIIVTVLVVASHA